jgi:ankyrin repeat protein
MLLLGAKTDSNCKFKKPPNTLVLEKNYCLLTITITHENIKIIKLFLDNGCNPNNYFIVDNTIQDGNLEILKLLINYGVDIIENEHYFKEEIIGPIIIVKYLVKEYKPKLHIKNDKYLKKAIKFGKYYTVKFLLENGANIQSKNNEIL